MIQIAWILTTIIASNAQDTLVGVEAAISERWLNHTGVLTCEYQPPGEVYISVEWRYNIGIGTWDDAQEVYFYDQGSNGTGSLHLAGRSHPLNDEPGKTKLLIDKLNDTDEGYYFCRYRGGAPKHAALPLYVPITPLVPDTTKIDAGVANISSNDNGYDVLIDPGSDLFLQVESKCTKPAITYTWINKGRGTVAGPFASDCYGANVYGKSQTNLTITNVNTDDYGTVLQLNSTIDTQTLPIYFNIVAYTLFGVEADTSERWLNHTGVLTCEYQPPGVVYSSVEWRYNIGIGTWDDAQEVYFYNQSSNGTGSLHLAGRSHPLNDEPGKTKLEIYHVNDTDEGYYFCRYRGGAPKQAALPRYVPITRLNIVETTKIDAGSATISSNVNGYDVSIDAGSDLILQVQSKCTKPAMTYEWINKGRGNVAGPFASDCYGANVYGKSQTNLSITKVQKDDGIVLKLQSTIDNQTLPIYFNLKVVYEPFPPWAIAVICIVVIVVVVVIVVGIYIGYQKSQQKYGT